jgi:hypothetical protein
MNNSIGSLPANFTRFSKPKSTKHLANRIRFDKKQDPSIKHIIKTYDNEEGADSSRTTARNRQSPRAKSLNKDPRL